MANNIFKSFWNYIREPDFNKNREIGAYDVVTKSSKKANDLSPGDKIMVHGEKLEVKAVRVREGGEGFIYFTDGTKTNTSDDTSYEIVKSHDRVSASPEDETPIGEQNQEKKKNTLSEQEQNNSHPYDERSIGGSKMLTDASEAKVHMNKVGREISIYWIQGIGADGKVRKVDVKIPAKKLEERLEDFKRDPQNMKVAYGNDSGAKEEWARKSISKGVNDKYITEMEKELKKLESAWSGDEDEEYFEGRKINFPEEIDELKSKIRILRANNAEKSQVQKAGHDLRSISTHGKYQVIEDAEGFFVVVDENRRVVGGGDLTSGAGFTTRQAAERYIKDKLVDSQGVSYKAQIVSKALSKYVDKDLENKIYDLAMGQFINESASFGGALGSCLEKYGHRLSENRISVIVHSAKNEFDRESKNLRFKSIAKSLGDFITKADEERKVYEIWISENPKTGFRLFKRYRASRQFIDKVVKQLKTGYYVSVKEVSEKSQVKKDTQRHIGHTTYKGHDIDKFINDETGITWYVVDDMQMSGEFETMGQAERAIDRGEFGKSQYDNTGQATGEKDMTNGTETEDQDMKDEDVGKDVGVAFAGPVPNSLLARQDLAGGKKKKKKLNKAISGYFTKLGIEPFGQAYKGTEEETPTFDEIKEVADGENPDEGTGAIQNIEDLTGAADKSQSTMSDTELKAWLKKRYPGGAANGRHETSILNDAWDACGDLTQAKRIVEDYLEMNKTQKSASYSGWEDMIITSIENLLEVTRSDAQGIVEAQEFLLAQEWAKGTPSYQVAKLIASKSSLKTQKAGKKTNYRGHTITEENGSFAVDDNAEYDTMEQAKRVIDRGEDEDKDNHDTDKARKVGKSLGDFLKKGNYDEEIEGEQSDKENYERLAEENPTDAPVLEAISNQEAGHKRALEILDKEKSSPDPKDDPENRKPDNDEDDKKEKTMIDWTCPFCDYESHISDTYDAKICPKCGKESKIEKGRSDKAIKNMKTIQKSEYSDYISRKKKEYGEKFDDSYLSKKFVQYFENGQQIRVKQYGETKYGHVGVTTGWKPIFILVHPGASGSGFTLSDSAEIVKEFDKASKSVDLRVGNADEVLVEDEFETQDENSNGGLMIRDLVNTAVRLRREMKSDQRIRMTLMQDFGLRGSQLEEVIELANNTILAEGGVEQDPSRVLDKSFTKSYTEMKQGKDLKIVNPHKVNKFRDFWLGK